MGHKQDFWERLRGTFAPFVGRLLFGVRRRETSDGQFVGVVNMSEESFEAELHDMGFHRNPASYWKYIPRFGGEAGSWRKTHGEWQLHVILFSNSDERTHIYAHWEYRWDRHPIKHVRGTGANASKGVNEMRRELKLASIHYDTSV